MKALICAFALSFLFGDVYAQTPRIALPELSFGVRNAPAIYASDIDQNDWWPDSRIWAVPSRIIAGNTQWNEVLVPVFIENNWRGTTASNSANIVFDEISSFAFRVYYDDRVLMFVDIQKHHPFTEEEATNLRDTRFYRADPVFEYYKPLSEHFHLTHHDAKATDYFKYFNSNDVDHNGIGRSVRIAGEAISSYSLPTTESLERRVLLYLRFRVLPTTQSGAAQRRSASIYFDPTYINYNGVNIAQDYGHKLLKSFPVNSSDPGFASRNVFSPNSRVVWERNNNLQYLDTNSIPSVVSQTTQALNNMVGIQRYFNFGDINKYSESPYLPGTISLNVMNIIPRLRFDVENPNSILVPVTSQIVQSSDDESIWNLVEPITADHLNAMPSNYNNLSGRTILVRTTGDPRRTMEDIIIETDQPWLFYGVVIPGVQNIPLFRRGFIQRINNLITDGYNPLGIDGSNRPRDLGIYIACSQAGLEAGEYTGHITFKSKFDLFEPTRIAVRFIVLDSPIERYAQGTTPTNQVVPFGIRLTVSPFNGTTPHLNQTLIMGSAPKATDLADSLYGEYAHPQPLGFNRFGRPKTFDARFFIDNNDPMHPSVPRPNPATDPAGAALWTDLVNNGFGDFSHLDGVVNDGNARSVSRDIRSAIPSEKSHIFYVRFKHEEPAVDFYPVVLTWDVNQMIQNTNVPPLTNINANNIYLRYILNGETHTIDMRSEGTAIGNNRFTFTFHDKSVQEFWIEYTIAEEIANDLVDNFGDPMIVPNSWNFVSLPLNPVNKHWATIFPNATGIPVQYSATTWQQPDQGMLQPGIGYFVRYQNTVDRQFTGGHFYRINRASFPVRLYSDVWNAIGALSVPVNVSSINFEAELASITNPNPQAPDRDFTLTRGVWAYNKNQGYREVPTLLPGQAYWIKVNRNGFLNISAFKTTVNETNTVSVNRVAGFDRITVADNMQKTANIFAANNVDASEFQLPPVPPTELFDVRFRTSGSYASNYDESIVQMQGVTYPVSIGFDRPRANYTVIDPATGFVYGTVKAGSTENVVIHNSSSNAFKLVAEASETFFVSVNQNPVTTSNAEVVFGINSEANVVLSVFNALGNEVVNLEVGELAAGVYNRNINVANLPSGSYTVRLLAGSESKIFRMNVVR